jgi:ATP-dependent DNA helicase RecG
MAQRCYKPGVEYIVFGKPTVFGKKYNIAHPEVEPVTPGAINQQSAMQPVYNSSEKLRSRGLDSKGISKLLRTLLPQARLHIRETLPEYLLNTIKLPGREETLTNIHFPTNPDMLQKAVARLKFEELFYIQLNLLRHKLLRTEKAGGHVFPGIGDFFNRFYHERLAFELTNAQKRVIKEISLIPLPWPANEPPVAGRCGQRQDCGGGDVPC